MTSRMILVCEPEPYWTPELQRQFACGPERETYGRLATIFCNHQPAVDLLEVAAPVG